MAIIVKTRATRYGEQIDTGRKYGMEINIHKSHVMRVTKKHQESVYK